MADDPTPTPWTLIRRSRKGLLTLLLIGMILLMATGFVVLILVQVFQGKMDLTAGMTLAFGTLFTFVMGAVALVWKFTEATAAEDVAKATAAGKPQVVNQAIVANPPADAAEK